MDHEQQTVRPDNIEDFIRIDTKVSPLCKKAVSAADTTSWSGSAAL